MYQTLHTCTDTQDPDKRRDAEKRIHTCYLESLIYDNIYRHSTLDDRHLERLEITKKDFLSCFPRIELVVHIDYINIYPRALTIIKKINGKIRFTEIYTRNVDFSIPGNVYSDGIVKVILTNASGVFIRYQSFDGIGRQIKVDSKSVYTTIPESI
jgi:hypothetical protein